MECPRGGTVEKRGKAREENSSGGGTLFEQNLANNRKNCAVINLKTPPNLRSRFLGTPVLSSDTPPLAPAYGTVL